MMADEKDTQDAPVVETPAADTPAAEPTVHFEERIRISRPSFPGPRTQSVIPPGSAKSGPVRHESASVLDLPAACDFVLGDMVQTPIFVRPLERKWLRATTLSARNSPQAFSLRRPAGQSDRLAFGPHKRRGRQNLPPSCQNG